MQKIIPHLWFNTEVIEATEFYVSAFGGDSKVTNVTTLHDTPSGDCVVVSFVLCGYSFSAFSQPTGQAGTGPVFTINPSISFMLNFDPSTDKNAQSNLDALWEKLSDGGTPLMPLDTYPFSERYGWIQDKFGVTWQLILTKPEGEKRPFIVPSLMFTGDNTGKADKAIDYYVSVFKDSKRGMTAKYPPGAAPEKDAKIMFADFMLEGQWFAAMDSGHMHKFGFNEGISLIVRCKDQAELDAYGNKLSAIPDSEQCGWMKDTYGVSWQVVPEELKRMIESDDQRAIDRVTQALQPMKKLDLQTLKKAYQAQ